MKTALVRTSGRKNDRATTARSFRPTSIPDADQWADRICKQLGKTVESIIDVGRVLVKAKAALPHGEWGRLFTNHLVPFGQNTAGKLIAIAQHPSLSNSDHDQNLPPSWTTLYQLTKVEPKRLTAALKDGTITPDMKRRAVSELLPPRVSHCRTRTKAPRLPIAAPAPLVVPNDNYRTPASALYFQVMAALSDGLNVLAADDRDGVLEMLRQSIDDLRSAPGREEVAHER